MKAGSMEEMKVGQKVVEQVALTVELMADMLESQMVENSAYLMGQMQVGSMEMNQAGWKVLMKELRLVDKSAKLQVQMKVACQVKMKAALMVENQASQRAGNQVDWQVEWKVFYWGMKRVYSMACLKVAQMVEMKVCWLAVYLANGNI